MNRYPWDQTTLQELREVIATLDGIIARVRRRSTGPEPLEVHPEPASALHEGKRFEHARLVVPERIRQLAIFDLPASSRLTRLFRMIPIQRLGEVDGFSARDVIKWNGCGRGTFEELRALIARAASGEFDTPEIPDEQLPMELLRTLDRSIEQLPAVPREVLLRWIGEHGDVPETSASHAGRLGVTRQRIHQIREKAALTLKASRGPLIPRLLGRLKQRCAETAVTLTPELLLNWLGGTMAGLQLPCAAHVRLIGLLEEGIRCSPAIRRHRKREQAAEQTLHPAIAAAAAQLFVQSGEAVTSESGAAMLEAQGAGTGREVQTALELINQSGSAHGP